MISQYSCVYCNCKSPLFVHRKSSLFTHILLVYIRRKRCRNDYLSNEISSGIIAYQLFSSCMFKIIQSIIILSRRLFVRFLLTMATLCKSNIIVDIYIQSYTLLTHYTMKNFYFNKRISFTDTRILSDFLIIM